MTVTDAVLAFPLAYFMARLAGKRTRAFLFVMVLLPLWSSYLVRIYAWQTILAHGGAINWGLNKLGLPDQNLAYTNTAMWIVFSYVWLPFMVLPVYAALERIPDSYLEASADLGASGSKTLRSRDPAARVARPRGRLDLHVRPDARRLHHAVAHRRHELAAHRQHHLQLHARGEQLPSPLRSRRSRWRSSASTCCSRGGWAPSRHYDRARGSHLARRLVGAGDRVPLDSARPDRALRLQRLEYPGLADHELDRSLVLGRMARPGSARRVLALGGGRPHCDRDCPRPRDDGRGCGGPVPLLRTGGGLVPARPAAGAARDPHRHSPEYVVHLLWDSRPRCGRS